jgi:hypothetical protein
MGRPKGAKSTSQKPRNSLPQKEIRQLIEDYGKLSNKELLLKYNISESQLRTIRRESKIKDKNISRFIKGKLDLSQDKIFSGVYCICRSDLLKIYIGSSKNIIKRINAHICELKNGTHSNKELLKDFTDGSVFYFFLLEECNEDVLLKFENKILSSLNKDILYNKNFQDDHILEEVCLIFQNKKDKILLDNNGCHIWTGSKTKDGYGKFVYKKKHYLTHRVAFYLKSGEFANLVHHKCNNKSCCNPDHLENFSYSQNNRAYRIDNGARNSKLFPFMEEIKKLRGDGKTFREIVNLLELNASHTTVLKFYNSYCGA